MNKVGLVIVSLTLYSQSIYACTSFQMVAADSSRVYARTMEFAFALNSDLVVTPRKLEFVGSGPNNSKGLIWRAKYGAVGMNAFDQPIITDGMNEKGLAANLLYLAEKYGGLMPAAPRERLRALEKAQQSASAPAPQPAKAAAPAADFAAVSKVIEQRCYMCHGAQVQMKNVRLDSPEGVKQHAQAIYQQVVVTRQMPMNNATSITEDERALIGAWLISPTARRHHVDPADFYHRTSARIATAIHTMNTAGDPIDQLTVADHLERAGHLDAIGGPATLAALDDPFAPGPAATSAPSAPARPAPAALSATPVPAATARQATGCGR